MNPVQLADREKVGKALHKMHKALQDATRSMLQAMVLLSPQMDSVQAQRANTMSVRLQSVLEVAETSFADPHVGTLESGIEHDGPVAMIQTVDGISGRLFVHGVLIRAVGSDVELSALRRVADMINEAATK
jgi:hypothetical protein